MLNRLKKPRIKRTERKRKDGKRTVFFEFANDLSPNGRLLSVLDLFGLKTFRVLLSDLDAATVDRLEALAEEYGIDLFTTRASNGKWFLYDFVSEIGREQFPAFLAAFEKTEFFSIQIETPTLDWEAFIAQLNEKPPSPFRTRRNDAISPDFFFDYSRNQYDEALLSYDASDRWSGITEQDVENAVWR